MCEKEPTVCHPDTGSLRPPPAGSLPHNLGHPIPWGSRVFRFLFECQLSSCHQHPAQGRAWHVASPRGQLPHSMLQMGKLRDDAEEPSHLVSHTGGTGCG